MVSSVESQGTKLDYFLWILVFTLVAVGVVGHYYLGNQSLLLRTVGYLAIAVASLTLASRTTKGRSFWILWKESLQEVRKMVWPSRQETVQTTLAVLAMVVVMGLLLWTTDFLLLRAVAWLTGNWGT